MTRITFHHPLVLQFTRMLDEEDYSIEYVTSKPTAEENVFWNSYKKQHLDITEQDICESSKTVM